MNGRSAGSHRQLYYHSRNVAGPLARGVVSLATVSTITDVRVLALLAGSEDCPAVAEVWPPTYYLFRGRPNHPSIAAHGNEVQDGCTHRGKCE